MNRFENLKFNEDVLGRSFDQARKELLDAGIISVDGSGNISVESLMYAFAQIMKNCTIKEVK